MVDYLFALDLGQATDYSALAVLERRWWREGQRPLPDNAKLWHHCPTLMRWPLGTPYPKIVQDVAEAFELFSSTYAKLGVRIVVDAGGPGRPVIDVMKSRPYNLRPVGVTITSGDIPHDREDGTLTVPKRDICSALVVASQSGDFTVAKTGQEEAAEEFEKELEAFGYTIRRKSGKQGYESIVEDVHDDMVVAAALGLWYSTVKLPRNYFDPKQGGDVAERYNPLESKRR